MQEVVKEKVIFAVNCGRQSRCLNTIRTKQKKKSVIISRAIDIEKSPLECGQKGKRKNLIVEEIKGKQEFTFHARGVLLRHQKQQAFRRWIECAPYRHLCDST